MLLFKKYNFYELETLSLRTLSFVKNNKTFKVLRLILSYLYDEPIHTVHQYVGRFSINVL